MPNSEGNRPVIPVLTGPTGSGKTGVALELLKLYPQLNIISCDSRQIYKRLSIGTDKPSPDILKKYNFFLTDFIEPGERYTVFDFVEDADRIIGESLDKPNFPPLVCGGTGLYIQGLTEGIVEIPDGDFSIRDELENLTITRGPQFLFEELEKVDPDEAAQVHPHNIKKIIRALEIYRLTGKSKTELHEKSEHRKPDYDFETVCLLPPREELYEKINNRVDQMIESGLESEVRKLVTDGYRTAVETVNVIGYNEFFKYFDGELSFDSAVNLIKQNSRRYAKRQITWFRGMANLKIIDNKNEIIDDLHKYWAN
ncbi:MAG: tRNA (adenosine(37)-N6)-dimethylallyltransferase MiaA [Candidatus Zixiibacteriota bacterium]